MERSDDSLFSDCWHSLRDFLCSIIDDENSSPLDYSYAIATFSVMKEIEKDVFLY